MRWLVVPKVVGHRGCGTKPRKALARRPHGNDRLPRTSVVYGQMRVWLRLLLWVPPRVLLVLRARRTTGCKPVVNRVKQCNRCQDLPGPGETSVRDPIVRVRPVLLSVVRLVSHLTQVGTVRTQLARHRLLLYPWVPLHLD